MTVNMDEGDDYVPQMSQLDCSFGGDVSAVISSDNSMYSAQSQMPSMHHSMHYGNPAGLMQSGQMQPMGSLVSPQHSMMPGMSRVPQPISTSSQKPKATRRRKNAQQNQHANEQQQQMSLSGIPASGNPSAMMPSQQQQYMMGGMNPVPSVSGMPQKPMISTMQPIISKLGNDVQMRQMHDPYSHPQQQQQPWFQEQPQHLPQQAMPYRPTNDYMQQNTYNGRSITQHSYYPQQQDMRFSHPYYQSAGYPSSSQVGSYPAPNMRPSSISANVPQYYSEQNQGYYGVHNNHILRSGEDIQTIPPPMQQPHAVHPVGTWQRPNITGYSKPPTSSHQYALQMEIRQVEQQLQTMYDIPNRTMQMAHQIEQLQMKLQYLQQCASSMGDCRPAPQSQVPDAAQQQPVSVMQRGSEVQVSIKPDMPGHTLISVYHQYPSNGAPSTPKSFAPDIANSKDSIPPEPTPSTLRNSETTISNMPPIEQPLPMTNTVKTLPNDATIAKQTNNHLSKDSLSVLPVSNAATNSVKEAVESTTMVSTESAANSLHNSFNDLSQTSLKESDHESYSVGAALQQNECDGGDKDVEGMEFQPDRREVTKYENSLNLDRSVMEIIESPQCDDMHAKQDLNELISSEAAASVVLASDSPTNIKSESHNESLMKTQSYSTLSNDGESTAETKLLEDNEDEDRKAEPDLGSLNTRSLSIQAEEDESTKESNDKDSLLVENSEESHAADEEIFSAENSNVSKDEWSVLEESTIASISDERQKEARHSEHDLNDGTVSPDEEDETTKASVTSKEVSASRESTIVLSNEKEVGKKRSILKRKAGKGCRKVVPAKKRKKDDEVSDGEEDEDFIPELPKRVRKKGRAKRKEMEIDPSELPDACIEKRRSGRMLGVQKKSYDLQAKWDEMEEELVDSESGANTKEIKKEVPSEFVVERILSLKKNDDGSDAFFVKYKNKSYIHCEWKSQAELEEGDKRVSAKIKRFMQKWSHNPDQEEEEQFNSDFVVIEKVLDYVEMDDGSFSYVKWRSLPYEEATWEKAEIVSQEKIDAWKVRNTLDPAKLKSRARPSASDWRKIPEDITFKDGNLLREYQFEGVNWLLYCYYNRQNCILADEMGLGKTVQTICFLQRVYEYGIHGPFLIVVPLSTIHNWQREFEIWTDMNAVIYHGSAASRQLIQQTEFFYNSNDPKLVKRNVFKFDALITTFEMVVSDCEVLKKVNYRVCVIDEAHRLKNRHCKLLTGGLLSFSLEHRLLLTGTPLQNNVEELFSLLSFLEPEQFHSSAAFLEQFGQCQTEEQVQRLQGILKPMMLRRLKEDVEKSLQPKEETIIEVCLSNTQKKYYRAILERNFSHLCKGTSVPSLMNAMMELRKCCNHPFLINGAEEQIMLEMKAVHPELSEDELYQCALVQSSGKLVLISKLLPKLKADGHKVLIFSQMVRVLDIIEEFLVAQNYTFERIDGNVRGDLRQTAIDRFSKKDSDRFVFLLCTRAGGLGINLTAADTVIIFDSDWNPQNDLQAQARCHRIGQTKMVKVYRLITCNTYEREMFDKASLKLGLDKAVLQSTTALKDISQQLSRKEVEELLKKGAYGAIMEENNEASKFNEEDIETILLQRTTTITLEAGIKGSTFAKASFNSSTNREDIDIDDPNFWSKWAKKANIDTEMSQSDKELILLEPRNRKKRFEDNVYKTEPGDDTDDEESDESTKGRKKGDRKGERRKRREDEEYRPDELAFNKSEYFKVEKLLGQFGWGRWKVMRDACDFKEGITEAEVEHISRTLLLHCIREYRGDEKIREFVWRLIAPKGSQITPPSKSSGQKKSVLLTSMFHEGWAALPEYNPPAFAVDSSFQRHVHRHSNKLLVRMHQLNILNSEIIGSYSEAIMGGKNAKEIGLAVELPEPLVSGWDSECDKSLLVGAHKHGLENIEAWRSDEALCFVEKKLATFPSSAEIYSRFRKLLTYFQRKRTEAAVSAAWSHREESEFMRVLKSYGVKDDPSSRVSWTRFRQLCPAIERRTDSELMEHLCCVFSMCTKQLDNPISAAELQRAMKIEPITARQAQKLVHRMNMMRQIHNWCESLSEKRSVLKLCSYDAMPNGWSFELDEELLLVVDQFGLDNLSNNIAHRASFKNILRPDERTLLRRVAEIYTTLHTNKWNGTASVEMLEDSDAESTGAVQARTKRGRKKVASNVNPVHDIGDIEKEKMRALAHQSFLQRLEQFPLSAATAAAMAQGLFLPLLSGATPAQQAAMLSLFGLPSASSPSSSTRASQTTTNKSPVVETENNSSDVLNLSTKKNTSRTPSASAKANLLTSDPASVLNNINLSEVLALANLPSDTHIPVINTETGQRLSGEQAPKVANLGQWLSANPKFIMDVSAASTSSAISSIKHTSSEKTSVLRTSLSVKKADKSVISPSKKTSVLKTTLAETGKDEEVHFSRKQISTVEGNAADVSKANLSKCAKNISPVSTVLEPGEIPRPSCSTSTVLSEQPVAVFRRSTGTLLPADRWPSLKSLSVWLDKHPDCNVHSSSMPIAATVLSKSYADRLGGDVSTSSLEAMQMQMMLQQSLVSQSLLGLGAYSGALNPFLLSAATGAASSNKASPKDILNPMLATLMNSTTNALQLQQIQSLLALDPSLLLATQATASAPISALPSTSATSSSSTKLSTKRTSSNKGKLNAVVEKLSLNQS